MTGAPSPSPSWRRVGDTGALVELPDLDHVLALDARVRDAIRTAEGSSDARSGLLRDIVDVVPAARTLLVTVSRGRDLGALGAALTALAEGLDARGACDEPDEIELAVRYDGPDLEEVASLTGMTPDEVVAAHTGAPWRAAFGGFAPGFVYLTGGDPRLQVPRRSEPRTAVPPGSVALAGEFSAVYPRSSPGGWQLIGSVDVPMWDVDRDPPALVRPGMRVRFTSSDGGASAAEAGVRATALPDAVGPASGRLTVLAPGPRALLQDAGRPGLAHLGVGRSGAADRAAHALGQRLVGNDPGCAAIETTLGGLAVTSDTDVLVAITGAPAPAQINGRPVGHASVLRLGRGQVLRLGAPSYGLRSYLSVRGGLEVPPVLGSRSTDTLAGLGPDPLVEGAVLPIGGTHGALPTIDFAPVRTGDPGSTRLRILPGPRSDWLADPDVLTRTRWEVSSRSDRIGARLLGATVERHPDRVGEELATEGVVRGSIQVPPGGEPVLFLADHPVTGGYPVAAVVLDADVDRAAQLRPGDPVHLDWA